jgi:hypothetical protein
VRNPFDRAVSWYFWQKSIKKTNKKFKDFILSKGCNPLVPFVDWVFLEKECILNDHIRYENLEDDTKRIFSKWFNVDIVYPNAKSSQRKSKKHYTEYYDDESRKIIAEKYVKDLEYFGYKFG